MSVAHLYLNSEEMDSVINSFLDNLELKTTLTVLYGIVWTWGITGTVVLHNDCTRNHQHYNSKATNKSYKSYQHDVQFFLLFHR